MTTEELLKPRFKVIADFPAMMFEVGQIIPAYENGITYMVKINDCSEEYSMNDFPHLFKKLEWWEERSEEDMPGYIKPIKAQQYIFKVYTVIGECINFENRNGGFSIEKLSAFIPATREEYKQYISK